MLFFLIRMFSISGSLFLVPLLTRLLSFTDFSLVVMGSVSIIGEYVCYGMITSSAQSFLMWLGPTAGLISNAGVIAFRSMSTKLVGSKEKGMYLKQSTIKLIKLETFITIRFSKGKQIFNCKSNVMHFNILFFDHL